jgi:hypothetical protein
LTYFRRLFPHCSGARGGSCNRTSSRLGPASCLFEESRANATLSVVVVVVVVVVVGADLVVLCLQHWAEKKETKEIKQANKQARKKEIRVWLARSCCCGRLSSSRVRRRFGVAERASSIIPVSKAKKHVNKRSGKDLVTRNSRVLLVQPNRVTKEGRREGLTSQRYHNARCVKSAERTGGI